MELTAEEEAKLAYIDDERFQPSYEIVKNTNTSNYCKNFVYTFLTLFASLCSYRSGYDFVRLRHLSTNEKFQRIMFIWLVQVSLTLGLY